MRQVALGVLNYESTYRCLPASTILNLNTTSTANNLAWGIHGRILQFLEQPDLNSQVDLTQAWHFQAAIDSLQVPAYACPSDPQARELRDPGGGKVKLYPTTYGFNLGTRSLFDPASGRGGDGAFYPNSHLSFAGFSGRDQSDAAGRPSQGVAAVHPQRRAGQHAIPKGAVTAAAMVASGAQYKDTGHTEWPDGRVHHTGFTAALTPNTAVPYTTGGQTLDADYSSWEQGADAVPRAHLCPHDFAQLPSGDGPNPLVDGSVWSIPQTIDLGVWRAWRPAPGAKYAGVLMGFSRFGDRSAVRGKV